MPSLCGRRVKIDIKSRNLAVARDNEIDTGVRGRLAFGPRARRQACRVVQNLRLAMQRINKMGMRRSAGGAEHMTVSGKARSEKFFRRGTGRQPNQCVGIWPAQYR